MLTDFDATNKSNIVCKSDPQLRSETSAKLECISNKLYLVYVFTAPYCIADRPRQQQNKKYNTIANRKQAATDPII